MQKLKKINCNVTFSVIAIIILTLELFLFKDILSTIVIIINTWMIVYLNGKCKYKLYSNVKNIKVDERVILKVFSVKDVWFDNSTILKNDYRFNTFLLPIIEISMEYSILIWLYGKNIVKIQTLFIIILFSILIFFFSELKHIIELIKNYNKGNNPLFNINGFGKIKTLKDLNCRKHHLKFEAIKIQYKNLYYTKNDLNRELAYIKARCEKVGKPGLYITIIFPTLVVLISSLINILSIYVSAYILEPNKGDISILNDFLKYSMGLPTFLIVILIVFSFSKEASSYTSIEDLKLRECALEELIVQEKLRNNIKDKS